MLWEHEERPQLLLLSKERRAVAGEKGGVKQADLLAGPISARLAN